MNKAAKCKKIWIKKSDSFKSAGRFDLDYYFSMSPDERVEAMQFLREMIFKLKPQFRYEKDRKRLRRVVKIVQTKKK